MSEYFANSDACEACVHSLAGDCPLQAAIKAGQANADAFKGRVGPYSQNNCTMFHEMTDEDERGAEPSPTSELFKLEAWIKGTPIPA
jgi:hypothetical protein